MDKLIREIGDTLTDVAMAASDAEAFCMGIGADEGQALRVGLALDELAANALMHGAAREEAPDIRVAVWADLKRLHLQVDARGPKFDPRERLAPANGAEDGGELGGRGLTMVLAFADELAYARRGERNITTFSVAKREGDSQK